MPPPKTANTPRGTVSTSSSSKLVNFTIRAVPLPTVISSFVRDNVACLQRLQRERAAADDNIIDQDNEDVKQATIFGDVVRRPTVRPEEFWVALSQRCKEAGPEWADVVDAIWAFGPRGAGDCLLIDARKNSVPNSYVLTLYFTILK